MVHHTEHHEFSLLGHGRAPPPRRPSHALRRLASRRPITCQETCPPTRPRTHLAANGVGTRRRRSRLHGRHLLVGRAQSGGYISLVGGAKAFSVFSPGRPVPKGESRSKVRSSMRKKERIDSGAMPAHTRAHRRSEEMRVGGEEEVELCR